MLLCACCMLRAIAAEGMGYAAAPTFHGGFPCIPGMFLEDYCTPRTGEDLDHLLQHIPAAHPI